MNLSSLWNTKSDKFQAFSILLIDDHAMMLDGLKKLIEEDSELKVVGIASGILEALQKINHHRPDLVITDFQLGNENAINLVRCAKNLFPKLKFIVVSMYDEVHLVKSILKEGVNGYVLKKEGRKELLEAISKVMEGRLYFSNHINNILINDISDADKMNLLSSRECEVLRLITSEYSNKRIAEILFIDEKTVETHRKNIFRKTQTNSLIGLISYAYANALI